MKARLIAVLDKTLRDSGINPHGSELGAIAEKVVEFIAREIEAAVKAALEAKQAEAPAQDVPTSGDVAPTSDSPQQ